MIAALISALANTSNLVADKIILTRNRVALKVYLPIVFIFLTVFTLTLTPFFGNVNWDIALLSNSLFLLFLMVVVAVAWNALYYQSVQEEKVNETEVVIMTVPLVTTILAAIFFPEEFDWRVFVLAMVASLALIFAKTSRSHFTKPNIAYNLFLAVILMATESLIIRELLYSYSPVALYAIRTFFIALFFMAYYRPRYQQVSLRHWWMIAGSAILGMIEMLARYYAYDNVGIIYTTLLLTLAPILVFIASWEFLHEKIRPRVVIAAIIVLICVTVATIIKF